MKKLLYILVLSVIVISCKEDDEPVVEENPKPATLIFPYKNSECNEGTNITATECTVMFEWDASQNTDEYELVITNLNTDVVNSSIGSETKSSVILDRGTPYSWYIISKSFTTDEIAQSSVWNFYNAGISIENYAPFPAEIVSPTFAEIIKNHNNNVTLFWIGNDLDNDIIGYDVYFGDSKEPELFKNDVLESILIDIPVIANTIYYWKIITKDKKGNRSDSGVYEFKIF